jgi:hypothetical protein
LAVFLLDTTVLVAHQRGDELVIGMLARLLAGGHGLATSCVNVAEYERGLRSRPRRRSDRMPDRLTYLDTTREAARRAGRYQREFASRGTTLHTADALVAGTARAHGAVLVTDNVADFPMPDVLVQTPEEIFDQLG